MNVYLSPFPTPKTDERFPSAGAMILIAFFSTICVAFIASVVHVKYTHRDFEGRYYARDLDGGYTLVLTGEKGYRAGDWVATRNDTIVTIADSGLAHSVYSSFEIIEVLDGKSFTLYKALDIESYTSRPGKQPFVMVLKGEKGYKPGDEVWARHDTICSVFDNTPHDAPYKITEIIKDKD